MSSAVIADRVLENGLARRRDLLAAGVHSGWLRRRLASGQWREPLPGVIDATGISASVWGWLRCGLLFAGPGSYLSHQTAAALHGLLPQVEPGKRVEIMVPHGRNLASPRALLLRQDRQASPCDFQHGLWVSTVAGTLVDLAGSLPLNDFRCVAADAIRTGATTTAQMINSKRAARSGHSALHKVVEELDAGAASGGEAAYWRAVVEHKLPVPTLNVEVATRNGRRFIDGVFADHLLAYEIDGRSVHAKAEAFLPDLRRHNDVAMLSLMVIRFAVSDVFARIDDVLTVTETILANRAMELGLTTGAATVSPKR